MPAESETVRRRRSQLAGPSPLERHIIERAREFDVIALLDLLRHAGYAPEDMVFKSHHSGASQSGLVARVEFRTDPVRQVEVTLNMGLLAADGLLPSYFQKVIDEGEIDEEAFTGFLHFFDHVLLQNFLASIYPEQNPQIYSDWERTKRSYVTLLGLRSTSTLHWIFQSVYPELAVSVDRVQIGREMTVMPAKLGSAKLGGPAALGATAQVPVAGCAATVRVDSAPDTNGGQPFYMVVRSVEPAQFATEGYDVIAQKVFATPSDPTILATEVIYPGVARKVTLEKPGALPVSVYFLFTRPGDRWKTTRPQPLPSSIDIELGPNQIKSDG